MRVALGMLVGLLVLAGSASSQPRETAPFRIQLERTVCYGVCPEYVVTVRADGRVVYVGRRGVRVTGVRRARITQAAVRSLRRAVAATGVFKLESVYDHMSVTDLPSAKLTVQVGSRTKRIYHYHGDLTAPKKLTRLECIVDRILRTKRWVGRGNEYVCSNDGFQGKSALALVPPPPQPPSPADAFCLVPRVTGMKLVRAKRIIRVAGCKVGTVRRTYSSRVKRGRVLWQRPTAGRRFEQGHPVNLMQSRGRRPARGQNRR